MKDKEKVEKIKEHVKEGKEHFQSEMNSGKSKVGSREYMEWMYWCACLTEVHNFIEQLEKE